HEAGHRCAEQLQQQAELTELFRRQAAERLLHRSGNSRLLCARHQGLGDGCQRLAFAFAQDSNLQIHDGWRSRRVIMQLKNAVRPLESARDLDVLIDTIGDARFVLLGEASHGTSEFYTWRTEISKRLVTERGFSFIGVEGDWPDCYRVNRYVRTLPDSGSSAEEVLHAFERWPTWMWANREVVSLSEWLHEHNRRRAAERQVGFY